MLEEEVARYTESHHMILCGDFKSRTGRTPGYDNNSDVLNEHCNENRFINKYRQSLLFMYVKMKKDRIPNSSTK